MESKPADLFLFPLGLHHFLLLLQPYFLQTHAATCEDNVTGCSQRADETINELITALSPTLLGSMDT